MRIRTTRGARQAREAVLRKRAIARAWAILLGGTITAAQPLRTPDRNRYPIVSDQYGDPVIDWDD